MEKSAIGKIAIIKVLVVLNSTIKHYYCIVIIKVIVFTNIVKVITLLNKNIKNSNSNHYFLKYSNSRIIKYY